MNLMHGKITMAWAMIGALPWGVYHNGRCIARCAERSDAMTIAVALQQWQRSEQQKADDASAQE